MISGGGVGRGRTSPRHTLLWSAVKLVAKYFSHCHWSTH